MVVKVLEERDISDEIDKKIKEGLCISFPDSKDFFSTSRYWSGDKPVFSVVGFDGSKVVAHIAVIERDIEVETTGRLKVFGIQNVFILPELRGQKILDGIMDEVYAEVKKRGYTFGLLFCIPKLEKVYARYGWKKLTGTDIFKLDDNGEKAPFGDKGIAMYYHTGSTGFPPGDINLMGRSW